MKHRIPAYRYTVPQTSARERDVQQVQAVLDGAQELWEPLCSAAYGTVLRCAETGDPGHMLQTYEYQDITDEAFARCYTQLERFRGLSRFAYWVGGYARNIARNRCSRERTRMRNERLLKDAASERMNGCDPLLILLRLERDRCLWRAFFELSVTDRRIVEARIFENAAPRMIAHELEMTRKEVLAHYEAAIVALRWHFNRYYAVYYL